MTPEQSSASRALFSVTPDPVAVLEVRPDDTVIVETANPAFARAVGRAAEVLPGTPLAELYGPHALDDVRDRLRHVVRELPTGRHVHRCILTPLPLGRVLLVEHDLSAERATEQRLDDIEHLTRTGTWSWNLEDDDLRLSGEFLRIVGLSETSSPTIRDALAVLHTEDRDRVRDALAGAAAGRPPEEIYARVVQPDGRERDVSIRATLVTDRDGTRVRLAGTMQDITELRAMEEAEAVRQRMVRQQTRALQLNDDVLQSLARAWLALDLERADEARHAITESMDRVRHIVAELLHAAGELHGTGRRRFQPGDLAQLRAVRDDEPWSP